MIIARWLDSYQNPKSGGKNERTVFIQNRNQTQNFYGNCEDGIWRPVSGDAGRAKELKELEEKNIIAQNQLKDTQSSYDRTKVEYERLEQELEDLNSKMDALRISGQEQAIRKQQLEGQINVLNEQILAGTQNEEHYKGRIQTIEAELSVRTDSKKKLEEEKTDIYAQLKAVRKKLSDG